MAKKNRWIQKTGMKKGALRKELGVKSGEKIPESKLRSAEHSKNPKLRKRAVMAETLRKLPRHRGSRGKRKVTRR